MKGIDAMFDKYKVANFGTISECQSSFMEIVRLSTCAISMQSPGSENALTQFAEIGPHWVGRGSCFLRGRAACVVGLRALQDFVLFARSYITQVQPYGSQMAVVELNSPLEGDAPRG